MTHKSFAFLIFLFAFNAAKSQSQPVTLDSTKVEASSNFHFERVEVEASFPGGPNAWRTYLMKNLRANVPLKKKAPTGNYVVVVRFIVGRDGSISDIAAETNHGHGMEEEVIRIIKKGPRWTPARQNGRPVKAFKKQPVTFVLP